MILHHNSTMGFGTTMVNIIRVEYRSETQKVCRVLDRVGWRTSGVQWRTQKNFMGGFHSVAYGGHLFVVCSQNRVVLKIFAVLIILFTFRILSNLHLPWKTELPWNFSLYWIYFLHSRFLSNSRLPWKTEGVLNSLYWICIFYYSEFLSNLRLPWKTDLPWNFLLYWICIFYHLGFLSNLHLPWKQSLPWNFSNPPPHTLMLFTYYTFSPTLKHMSVCLEHMCNFPQFAILHYLDHICELIVLLTTHR